LKRLFLKVETDRLVIEFSVADLGDKLKICLMVEGNRGVIDHNGDGLIELIVV
jgi:hypothetical protein